MLKGIKKVTSEKHLAKLKIPWLIKRNKTKALFYKLVYLNTLVFLKVSYKYIIKAFNKLLQ